VEQLVGGLSQLGRVAAKAALLYVTAVTGFRVARRRTLAELSAIDFVAAVAGRSDRGPGPGADYLSLSSLPGVAGRRGPRGGGARTAGSCGAWRRRRGRPPAAGPARSRAGRPATAGCPGRRRRGPGWTVGRRRRCALPATRPAPASRLPARCRQGARRGRRRRTWRGRAVGGVRDRDDRRGPSAEHDGHARAEQEPAAGPDLARHDDPGTGEDRERDQPGDGTGAPHRRVEEDAVPVALGEPGAHWAGVRPAASCRAATAVICRARSLWESATD
jgi:hypothetical protein